jgi:CHAT domain-containing protein/tetratricopeptide (TPR) repeat protein
LTAADLLVETKTRNGQGARPDVQVTAARLVVAKEQYFGAKSTETAASLRNLGTALTTAGEYDRARLALSRAVDNFERATPPPSPQLADALHGLGDAEIRADQYDVAERTLARALSLKETLYGQTDVRVVETLERQAYLLLQKGEYAAARPLLDRGLEIAEAAPEPHADAIALLDTRGMLAWFEGDIVESEALHRRALELATRDLPSDHASLPRYQRNLASTLWDLGRASESRDLLRDALASSRRTLGNTHPEVVWVINDLANSEVDFGDYAAARRLYEEALAALEERFGPASLSAATILHNLALFHATLGDSVEATRRMDEALKIWQRVLGPSHPYVGRALDSMAEVLSDQNRTAEARALFERALRIRENAHGTAHRDVAETLTKLAIQLKHLGEVKEADQVLSRAMTIWAHDESSVQAGYDGYGAALTLAGELQIARGNFSGARRSFERALERGVALVGPTHPATGAARIGLASAMQGLNLRSQALRLALEAEHASRNHVRLAARSLSERDGLSVALTRDRGLDLALSFPVASATDETAALLDAVVRSRALALEEMSERNAFVRETGNPRLDAAHAAVVVARERFASLLVRGTGSDRPQGYRVLLDEARREMEAAERTLAEQSAEFRRELVRQHVGLDDVRQRLPPSTALVSFVRYMRERPWQPGAASTPSYVAFVLTRRGRPALVTIGPATRVEALVDEWRVEATIGGLRPITSTQETAYRVAGTALRQLVWDPVASLVASSSRVLIVPDGALNLVSFASLPIGTDRYLIEVGPALHYLAAERDVSLVDDVPSTPTRLLALGGPDFDVHPSAPESGDDLALVPGASQTRGSSGCAAFNSLRFQPLPATRREVQEIATIFKASSGGAARVFTGASASEGVLKSSSADAEVVHLATHGFFLGDGCSSAGTRTRGIGGVTAKGLESNPLKVSGLALAGANQRQVANGGDDGILTAEEVAGLDLRRAVWVVLSACDTGVGEVAAGEGVLGLRRAFRVAGARTLVMSLWSVDDDATRLLMRALYDNRLVRRRETVDSMREAGLAILRERRASGETTHPFYWGSFVAVGDWS